MCRTPPPRGGLDLGALSQPRLSSSAWPSLEGRSPGKNGAERGDGATRVAWRCRTGWPCSTPCHCLAPASGWVVGTRLLFTTRGGGFFHLPSPARDPPGPPKTGLPEGISQKNKNPCLRLRCSSLKFIFLPSALRCRSFLFLLFCFFFLVTSVVPLQVASGPGLPPREKKRKKKPGWNPPSSMRFGAQNPKTGFEGRWPPIFGRPSEGIFEKSSGVLHQNPHPDPLARDPKMNRKSHNPGCQPSLQLRGRVHECPR